MPFDVHREVVAVDLTDPELLDRCRDLRTLVQEIREKEETHKALKETIKGQMAELLARYRALLQIVATGRIEKEMEIKMVFDLAKKQVYHLRLDTGSELAGRRRQMTDNEFAQERARQAQAELPLTPKPTTTDGTQAPEPPLNEEQLVPADGPLLMSCEGCGHPREDHLGLQGQGKCAIVPCECPAYVPFASPPEPADGEPMDEAAPEAPAAESILDKVPI